MLTSRLRRKFSRGETVICAKAGYQDPDIVELIGTFGFDGVWICLEHRRLDPLMIGHLIRAARLAEMDPILRVKPASYTDLLWLLEAGARAVMLPRVTCLDEVREAIAAMKFPPAGRRGYDGVQADAGFGRIPAADYLARANDETCLIVQIEEPAVLPHLDALAALPGVDVLFVGPGDLTLALGKPGRTDDADVQQILRDVVAACQRHGKVAGIPCPVDQVGRYHAMGFRFFNVISDYRCLVHGLAAVQSSLAAAGFPVENRIP